MNRLDGDAVGPVKVLVSNPLYSHDHQHVIIPEGTQVRLTQGGGHSVDSIPVAFRLGEFLAEHLDPLDVEQQLDAIYADTGRTSLFLTQSLNDAVTIMRGNYPANGYLMRKAGCLVDEFPRAFKRRPLRNLDLSSAFQTYVRKVLDI